MIRRRARTRKSPTLFRSERHGCHQGHIRNSRNLFCQHLQIRLRNRDDDSQQKAAPGDQADPARLGQLRPDGFPHWDHRKVGTEREDAHPENKQNAARQEQHQCHKRHGGNGEIEHQNNGGDRKNRACGFFEFFCQDFPHSLLPFAWISAGSSSAEGGTVRKKG